MTADLPVLWEAWANDPCYWRAPETIQQWAAREGLDLDNVFGVEVVVLDAPCLRVHSYAVNAAGQRYLVGPDIATVPPVLRPVRTMPPAHPDGKTCVCVAS